MPASVCAAVVCVASPEPRWPDLFGQAEVQNLHATIARHHHIGGFQIAVHDPFLMRGGERPGERGSDVHDALDWESAFRNQPIRAAALRCSSMVRKWTPSASSTEKMVTMCG